MANVTDGTAPDHTLSDIRERLDEVDTRLVGILAERGKLIAEVIDFKRTKGMGVVDRGREDEMLHAHRGPGLGA